MEIVPFLGLLFTLVQLVAGIQLISSRFSPNETLTKQHEPEQKILLNAKELWYRLKQQM